MPATGDELPDRRWALNASLALSGLVILVNVVLLTWANGQRRDFDAMLLQDPPLPRPDGWEYMLGYLLVTFALGLLALALGLLGFRSSLSSRTRSTTGRVVVESSGRRPQPMAVRMLRPTGSPLDQWASRLHPWGMQNIVVVRWRAA